MAVVRQAYKFAIDYRPADERGMRSHAGASRFAYNWGLGKCAALAVKSKKRQRKGRKLGFPKRKKKGKSRDSFRFGAGVMRCSGNTVTLPRLGTLKTHESTVKLASKVADGSARILSATVSRTAQRWFVSFTVEAGRDVPGTARESRVGDRG